ncbi:GerAB/ArcD/ProY family transporter [Geosporobacter ferrireducens]|uniref:GerAB/ArcD/ProY family transporter n=1 Tax=Geosporobacter ferrireducens TaxID=1424294 RepID=UPI002353D6B0|nr:endospore germination permease [Geosporobacter ferrireducens]
MNRDNDVILSSQLSAILVMTIMGVGILSLPRMVVEEAGPDGLFLVLGGSIFALLAGWIIFLLVKKFPGETIVEFGNTLLGKFFGTVIALGFFGYLMILSAYEVRSFGEITKQYLLFETPIEVLAITILLGSVYTARSGIESIARMAEFLFPIITIISVLILLPIIPEIDYTQFYPIFRTPILKLIKGIPVVFFSFIGIELTLLYAAFVKETKKIGNAMLLTVGLVSFYYISIVFVVVARFGLVETTHIIWPTLEVFKTVDLPGAFIENLDAFIMSIWVIAVFMSLVSAYYGSALILSRIFKTKEFNFFVLPLLPIIYFLAFIPDNLIQLNDWIDIYSNYAGSFFMVLLPLLLLIISFFKKSKGGKKNAP